MLSPLVEKKNKKWRQVAERGINIFIQIRRRDVAQWGVLHRKASIYRDNNELCNMYLDYGSGLSRF